MLKVPSVCCSWSLEGGGDGLLRVWLLGGRAFSRGCLGGGGGGVDSGWGGGVGGAGGVQHGPTQLGRLRLSSRFFRPVHLKCNQPLQLVQSADLQRPSLVMHCGQIQTLGPGFGSMPARMRSSLSSESGTCLVVRHFKNTIPQTASYRLCPTCRKTGWRDDLTCMGWEVGCWVLAAGVVAGGDGA